MSVAELAELARNLILSFGRQHVGDDTSGARPRRRFAHGMWRMDAEDIDYILRWSAEF